MLGLPPSPAVRLAAVNASSRRRRAVWLFNLDAEEELAGSRRYLPTRAVRERVTREAEALERTLARPGDLVLVERADGSPGALELRRVEPDGSGATIATVPPNRMRAAARGSKDAASAAPAALHRAAEEAPLEVRAWSPTPRARCLLARAGLELGAATDVEVLRRVNARAFAAEVRGPLAGASFEKRVATRLEDVLALVGRPSPYGWLVRRPYGAAGRGRRRLWAGRPDAGELAWIVASLRQGPLVVEPFVEITREYTRSGEVRANGEVVMFGPCAQLTTREGAWTASEALSAAAVGREDDAALAHAFEVVGRALFAAGYVGPFGIDAFRHRDPARPERDVLNPLSEINARYTMDWIVARGSGR